MPFTPTELALTLSLACAAPACDREQHASEPVGGVSLAIVPLVDGGPVKSAVFDVRIDTIDAHGNATPHLVAEGLTSDANGQLTWVGTCAAGADGSPGLGVATVTLASVELADGGATFGDQLPMTQIRPFSCVRGGDAPLDFRFDLVLQLDRGFTDVRVTVDALECAAKFDCSEDLLADADGAPGPTFITAVSCTGIDDAPLDNLISFTRELRCYDADDHLLSRSVAPLVADARTFTGYELAPGGAGTGTAYWNTATLLDASAIGAADHCRFEALAFVRSQPVGPPRAGWMRAGSSALRWDVTLRLGDDGALACDGSVVQAPVGLRIDEAPTPSDSRFSPEEAPVTQSTLALLDAKRETGCDAAYGAWTAATAQAADAAEALAEWERDGAIAGTLDDALARLGDPDADPIAGTLVADVAAARAAHARTGFDAAAVEAALDDANGVLAEVSTLLATIDGAVADDRTTATSPDAPPTLLERGAEVANAIATTRADADAGAFYLRDYDALDAAVGALRSAVIDARTAVEAARAALGDLATLMARAGSTTAAAADADDAYTRCLIADHQPTGALRLWSARDVTFPLPADGVTAAPAQDDLLWVRSPLGDPYDVAFESACMSAPDTAIVVVRLRQGDGDAQGVAAALLLLRGPNGDWQCTQDADGSCRTYPLSDLACDPEAP